MGATSAVTKVAASQLGVISRAQAFSLGLSKDQMYRLTRGGFWKPVANGVFIVNGFIDCLEQRAVAAIAWAGSSAAISHRTAASILGLEIEVASDKADVIAPLRRNKVPDWIHLHRSTLGRGDRASVRGISVTTATRTLLDLGSVVSRDDLELALEAALRKRLTSLPTLRSRLQGEARGRRGVAALRELLEVRRADEPPAESPLETRFIQFARRHRLPHMGRQFQIFDGDCLIARVDFAVPQARLAIEVLGYRWHSGSKQWHRDHVRLNRLAQMGWRVLFVTKDSLDSPKTLACEIRRALEKVQLFD